MPALWSVERSRHLREKAPIRLSLAVQEAQRRGGLGPAVWPAAQRGPVVGPRTGADLPVDAGRTQALEVRTIALRRRASKAPSSASEARVVAWNAGAEQCTAGHALMVINGTRPSRGCPGSPKPGPRSPRFLGRRHPPSRGPSRRPELLDWGTAPETQDRLRATAGS